MNVKFEVNEELVNYIQRLAYDVNSHRGVITKLIEDHAKDADASILISPVFTNYHDKLSSLEAEFEIAKETLENTVIPEKYRNFPWNLNYSSRILTISVPAEFAEKKTEE